jgi:hypothetical protein
MFPRIRTLRTARVIFERGILLRAFNPHARLARVQCYQVDFAIPRGIDKNRPMLIPCIDQASPSPVGRSPHPSVANPGIPMRTRRNGFGEFHRAGRFVDQSKTKSRSSAGSRFCEITRGKRDPGTKRHRMHLRGSHTGRSAGDQNRRGNSREDQTMPFPSTIWRYRLAASLLSFSTCLLGAGQWISSSSISVADPMPRTSRGSCEER